MKSGFLLFICALTAGCSTTQPVPTLAQPGRALPPEYVSPDSSLGLRFHVDPKKSHYDLVTRADGTHLATADSAIVAFDFVGREFRGTEDVTFATDGSGVVITENLSDAGPILRYILFHRSPSGSFEVRYLEPPTIFDPKCPAPAYSYEYPVATDLTAKRITFYYSLARKTKVMPLDAVTTTPTLQPQ